MRAKIVAGNWKMNKNMAETEILLGELSAKLPDTTAEVMVAPTYVNLASAVRTLDNSKIEVIAQNMHYAESGAFTGEISADMLLSVGIDTVIIGHSERRAYFSEGDEILSKKVATAIPIPKRNKKTKVDLGEKIMSSIFFITILNFRYINYALKILSLIKKAQIFEGMKIQIYFHFECPNHLSFTHSHSFNSLLLSFVKSLELGE